jgi:hypothetical protein
MDDLDERQVASWMKQAAAKPFFGAEAMTVRTAFASVMLTIGSVSACSTDSLIEVAGRQPRRFASSRSSSAMRVCGASSSR